MNQRGLIYLSGAIVFAVVTFAFMFRYEYAEDQTSAVNRFTAVKLYPRLCTDGHERYISNGSVSRGSPKTDCS